MELNKIQNARQENAYRIYSKINGLIKAGYTIIDDEKYKIFGVEWKHDDRLGHRFFVKSGNGVIRFFYGNPEYSEGLDISIKEFNEIFRGWKYVHPKNFKRLKV